MKQKDLLEEKETNFRLDKRLCQPYRDIISLDIKSTGISKDNISDIPRKCNILLDCGGIVEFENNYLFAKYWLENRKIDDKQAVIYFDMHKNTLQVLDLNGMIVDYETSSYKNNISKLCLVFLDQFHTRGTDLKLPKKSLACITLGSGLTRDELAQGAMRMRQLEKPLKKDAKEKQDENDDCQDFRFEQEFIYLATFDVFNEITEVEIQIPLKPQLTLSISSDCESDIKESDDACDVKLKQYLCTRKLFPVWDVIDKAHKEADEEIIEFDDLIGISESDLKNLCEIVELKGKKKQHFYMLYKCI